MKTLTLKFPENLDEHLAQLAKEKSVSKSELVRQAVAEYIAHPPTISGSSFLAQARSFCGCFDGPADLSTSKEYFRGFGE